MGEQIGAVKLPDIYGELSENENPLEWKLADRVKIALDLLNTGLSGVGGGIYYNFVNFGGVADGATDNSAALNTLITTVTASGGGTIYFPEGVYVFSSTITTADDCNIRFLGDGDSSILRTLVFVNPLFSLGANTKMCELQLDRGATNTLFIRMVTGSSVGPQWARFIYRCRFTSSTSPSCIEFATATHPGYGTIIDSCIFLVGTSCPIIARTGGADTLDNRRIFSNIITNATSYIDCTGMNGATIVGCNMFVPFLQTVASSRNITLTGNTLSIGAGWTIATVGATIVGNNLLGANPITLVSSISDMQFGPNKVDTGASIVVNCFSVSNNSVRFPRRSYGVTNTPGGGFTLGDGQLQGFVEWLGQHVSVEIGLQWGTTTTQAIPAAGFNFTLPTNNGVAGLFASVAPVGTGFAYNGNSYGAYCYCTPGGTRMLVSNMATDTITSAVDPIVPVNTNRYQYVLHYQWL